MHIPRKLTITSITLFVLSTLFIYVNTASAGLSGAIYSTTKDGTAVNKNIYGSLQDVYLSGGPQNQNTSGLRDGTYYFQVTDPSGKTLLSTDNAVCRRLNVTNGRVSGSAAGPCAHANGKFNSANGSLPVQLAPFSASPNSGNEYKVWLIPINRATISGSDAKVLVFDKSDSVTDNFKARSEQVIQGSCQPSSSLSVLVSGSNVVAYVPKGSWQFGSIGVAAANVEGSSITDTLIPTTRVINSCASNPITGQTVCTANNTDVYIMKGTTLDPAVTTNPLTSAGAGLVFFSGGGCTNCGVAMDATHNKAVISLSFNVFGQGGFQFLNLGASPAFEPAFAAQSPGFNGENISEDPLIDPIRNLLLSAAENNNYEIINVATSTSPQFFEHPVSLPAFGELDSSGEDCSTGIVLAPAEFSAPSNIFLADISDPAFAPFTAGSPGTWTAPSQVQILSESFLSAGSSGLAVAQGTHTGIVTGEFGGDEITAIQLPAVSGGGVTPAINDWVSCSIGNGFSNGLDPHTVTAYQSPTTGHAIAVLANFGATRLAVVDLTNMLDSTIVPRTFAGHGCSARPLPSSMVRFINLP
jgi:hypothetical protein